MSIPTCFALLALPFLPLSPTAPSYPLSMLHHPVWSLSSYLPLFSPSFLFSSLLPLTSSLSCLHLLSLPSFSSLSSLLLPPSHLPHDVEGMGSVLALYSYKADNADELTFYKGSVITVLSKDADEGWWHGELDNKTGLFPSNYVQTLDDQLPLPSSRCECAHMLFVHLCVLLFEWSAIWFTQALHFSPVCLTLPQNVSSPPHFSL